MCLSCTLLRKNRTEYLKFFTIVSSFLFIFVLQGISVSATSEASLSISKEAQVDAQTVEVILQRHYLDGEVSEEVVEETIWSMEDFWAFYGEWQLVDQLEGKVIFKQDTNDISPLLKMNGYFGLSEDGFLNIYNGKPMDNEVIQSFFQVNTSRLKSHLHRELLEGIPVSTKDHYLEVIKMFEEYAVSEF
ncbi:BofC C-terminal domain-containing protein [Evansella sp. AB-rgal1]|uniref:BofC C-terminal domain-containing protein n=1 Tax=Evansella sp. AB-rgal1 TaxID=3242696 RepID=UPI00359D7E34